MKTILAVTAIALISVSAFAGSHVEGVSSSYTVPAQEGAIKNPYVESAKLGKVVVEEHEEGNCDGVANDGDFDGCHTVATYAQKVRVTVVYTSPAGANSNPEAMSSDSEEGLVPVHFDFDPAQFDAATLAKLSAKHADNRGLFAINTTATTQQLEVQDYEHSTYCSPDADMDCQEHIVYKTVNAPTTQLTVTLK
jgi:hypothetical protein